MDNASYIALSRQLTLRRELDITANNIANMNTNGYKFEQLLIETEPGRPAFNDPIRTPANFAYDKGVGRDFSQGTLTRTGSPYDLALDGENTFFGINGPNGTVYTRNGAFTVNPQGILVTQNGLSVQGEGGAEIRLDPQYGEPSISADGIVSQRTPDGALRVGKLGITRIATLSDLEKAGDTNYSLKNPQAATPTTESLVRQGMLESSNVNSVMEITKLVEINRSYASLARLIDQNQELNRTAVERLGKVA